MRRVAFVDGRSFWTSRGRLKRPQDLTEEQGATMASFEALIKNAKAGDRKTDLIHKLKLWDKIRALEMLGKHFKLLTDVVQVEVSEADMAKLDEGRKANAEARRLREAEKAKK